MSLSILPNSKKNEKRLKEIGWGHSLELITKEQLEEVMNGKAIALFDGEYTTWIAIEEPKEEE